MDASRRVFLLLSCSLLPLAGYAEVYRWTDADGEVVYGDFPGAAAQGVRRIAIDPAPRTPTRAPPTRVRGKGRRAGPMLPDLGRLQVLANDGQVAVGMPARMVEQAWGRPEDTSQRTTRSGTSEVWSYTRRGRKVKVTYDAEGRVKSIAR